MAFSAACWAWNAVWLGSTSGLFSILCATAKSLFACRSQSSGVPVVGLIGLLISYFAVFASLAVDQPRHVDQRVELRFWNHKDVHRHVDVVHCIAQANTLDAGIGHRVIGYDQHIQVAVTVYLTVHVRTEQNDLARPSHGDQTLYNGLDFFRRDRPGNCCERTHTERKRRNDSAGKKIPFISPFRTSTFLPVLPPAPLQHSALTLTAHPPSELGSLTSPLLNST